MERHDRWPPASTPFLHLEPPPPGRTRSRWRKPEDDALAQDYQQYAWADYARRRRLAGGSWRDLYPAYVFARTSHRADWPRGADDTEAELAAWWELARGSSRWSWDRVRPVVEDAWRALDHMPAAVVHAARQ